MVHFVLQLHRHRRHAAQRPRGAEAVGDPRAPAGVAVHEELPLPVRPGGVRSAQPLLVPLYFLLTACLLLGAVLVVVEAEGLAVTE